MLSLFLFSPIKQKNMLYSEIKVLARMLRKNQTCSEQVLWKRIRDRQIEGYKFLRQHPIIYDRRGNDLNFFIPDFYCPEKRLIIEVDGSIHKWTVEYDRWREKVLKRQDLRILRIRNSELDKIDEVVERIRLELMR